MFVKQLLIQYDTRRLLGRARKKEQHKTISLCHMVCVKRKSVFEHAQNAQIQTILYMRKVSIGHLLSIYTFCSIQWLCLRIVKAFIRLRECAGWSGPSLSKYTFSHGTAHMEVAMPRQACASIIWSGLTLFGDLLVFYRIDRFHRRAKPDWVNALSCSAP